MKKSLLLSVSFVLGTMLTGCQLMKSSSESSTSASAEVTQAAELKQITGSIGYYQRIALPDNAQVTVTLSDVSKADAAASVIAQSQFSSAGKQVPLHFVLAYDPSKIIPGHHYAMSAKIEYDGGLRFISDTRYSVLTDAHKTDTVKMMLKGIQPK